MQSVPPATARGSARRAAHDTFRSLRVRNFRLFFVGQVVSQVGNWMTLVTQTLLVLSLTGNGVAVGVLTACQFLPVLLIAPWAGLVADRSDKRKLLLVVQVFAMAQSFLLATFAFMDHPPVAAFYVIAVFGGIATAFDNPARRSFVNEMVPEGEVTNAVSLNSALMMSARMVGPALAGLLIQTAGFGWCFLLDGISYVAVIVALWMIRPKELRPAPVTPRGKGQIREGFLYVRRTPVLWIPLVIATIVGTLSYNFQVVMPLLVTRTFGGTDATFTLLFSVLSVGSLIGAIATARRRVVGVMHVILASVGIGVALLVMAVSPTLGFAFGAAVLVGLATMVFMISWTSIVQLRADPTMRGRVLALQSMVFLGSTPIGGPIVGAVCDAFGPRAGLLLGSAAGFVGAAWGWFALWRRRLAAARSASPGEGTDRVPLLRDRQAASDAIPAIITTNPRTM
jgi:MFS family permease